MKIIHVIPTLGCGGAEILLGNIALEQVKRGDEVQIIILEPFHPTYSSYFLKDQLEKSVKISQIKMNISFSVIKNKIEMDITPFEEIVKAFKPDVIHSHLFQAEIVSRYKIYDHVKYITHCHNNMSQFSKKSLFNILAVKTLKRRITDFLEIKWLMKQYVKCDNSFVAISNDTKSYFENNVPNILRKNVFLLFNCINTSLYFSNNKSEQLSQLRLITVGNLTENKAHDFLINLVSVLRKSSIIVSLEILGYGPLESYLKEKIRELKLEEFVFLRGNVSNVNEFLSNADVYVHSSLTEGFGLVILEAMASKLPVVTTDGGGNKELILEAENGFLIHDRNINDFVDKIKLLFENKELREEMGNNAYAFSQSFDVVQYVDKLTLIY